jgi:MerR family transcriptional regulator/heat shock protein HspR
MRGTADYHTKGDGVYIISVAARILEMHPQTLRKYERIGLVSPFRRAGRLRRLYSEEDIARLRLIKHLVGNLGLNLAGVELVLGIFNRLLTLRAGAESLQGESLKRAVDQSLGEMFDMLGVGTR